MAKRSAAKIDESRGKQPEGHSIDSSPSDSPLADSDSEFSCIPARQLMTVAICRLLLLSSPKFCRKKVNVSLFITCASAAIDFLRLFKMPPKKPAQPAQPADNVPAVPEVTPPFVWTLDKEERLLLLIQRFPCLYDVRLTEYRNSDVKSNAFSEIARSLKCYFN